MKGRNESEKLSQDKIENIIDNPKSWIAYKNKLQIAVEALEKIQKFDPEEDTINEKCFDEWGEAESFRMCQDIAKQALDRLEEGK